MTSIIVCSDLCKKKYKETLPKKITTVSLEYWIEKGHTEEESKEIIKNIQRKRSPRRKEYWISQGLSEEESEKYVRDYQSLISNSDNRSKEERRMSSPRCIEYWIDKTKDIESAAIMLKECQCNNSYESLIKRYGVEEGTKKYKECCERIRYDQS